MLTSKEIIEKTGISRATLNNYISSGLVPRPQVLPPGPQDSAAPRIGYFPDDTIERVETIQRLKREGWSIQRIAEYFARPATSAAATPATAQRAAAAPATPAPVPATAPAAAAAPRESLQLSLGALPHPAYLVGEDFRVAWSNDEARRAGWLPFAGTLAATGTSIFKALAQVEDGASRELLVRLHLQAARQRGARIADLVGELAPEQAAWLEAQYRAMPQPEPMFLVQAVLAGLGGRLACALQFREGVLVTLQPAAVSAATADSAPRAARAAAAPTLTPVAVLVATLHDAAGLWVKLTAQEYFELLNEVAGELDRIFGQHRGRAGAQSGEVLVCYFLPDADGRYLWNALAAAQQTRDAMRQVSRRWQVRKGWDVELSANIGLDEGQDWIGALGASAEGELRVLGDAPERAAQLSRSGRVGTVLVTRNLLGKLSADERQRLTYGVPRPEGAAAEGPLLFTFARLQDIAAPAAVPARFADLAVAELLDLEHPTTTNPAPTKAG